MEKVFEFQKKLERTPGKFRNKPIQFPNGVVMSIQCSRDSACYPKQDFEKPQNYDQYEVAISYKDRWLQFPAYHDFFHDGIGERVPAKKVQEMYDMLKRMEEKYVAKLPYVKKASKGISNMRTWDSITAEYAAQGKHHCLKLTCPVCGNTRTCRCSTPKDLHVALCPECVSKGQSKLAADFGSPFSGNNLGRKMTQEELVRAMRFAIAAEYEAVQLYEQIAESSPDEEAAKVLRDIAQEEVVHAGEFLTVLHHLEPKEFESYAEGAKEVLDISKEAMEIAEGAIARKVAGRFYRRVLGSSTDKAAKEFVRMIEERARKENLNPKAIALSILARFR